MGAVAIGAFFFLAGFTRVVAHRLPQLIDSVAAEHLNGKLKIGRIETFGNCIRLCNVSIHRNGWERSVIYAPEVRVYCSISDLLMHRTNYTDGITSINIIRPQIFLSRDAKGKWNVAGILKPTRKKPVAKWHTIINVTSATLVVRDSGAKKFGPTENCLQGINASIDTARMPALTGKISGPGVAGRLGKFAVDAEYNLTTHSVAADLQLANVEAAYWSRYPVTLGINLLSGKMQVKGRVSKSSASQPITYSASVRFNNAALKFKPIHCAVKEVNGTADVVNGLISLNLTGKVGHSPLIATGYVLNPVHPRLLLRVKSKHADFREIVGYTNFSSILRKLILPTTGVASARIFGRPKTLAVSFDLHGPSASYGGFDYTDVRADGVYFIRRVTLRHASVKTCGGVLNGSGDIEFGKKPKVLVEGIAHGLKLQEFPMIHNNVISADSNGAFRISYGTGGLGVFYRGGLSNARLSSFDLGKGWLAAEYSGGAFRIGRLRMGSYGGRLSAAGVIGRGGAIALRVSGADVNLAELGKGRWKLPVVGFGGFSGEVGGKLSDPVFSGKVTAHRVTSGNLEIDRVSGDVVADRENVELSDVVGHSYPGTITLDGDVRNPLTDPYLDLSVIAEKLDVDALSEMMGRAPSTGGTAYGDLHIKGPAKDFSANGMISVQDAWYSGIPMDSLHTAFSYHDRTLKIDDLRLRSRESVLAAHGEVPQNGNISVQFSAQGVPLSKFSSFLRPYASLSGKLDIQGSLQGSPADPHAEIVLHSDKPAINSQVFDSMAAAISVNRSGATVHDLNLVDGESVCSVPKLSVDMTTSMVQVDLLLKNGEGDKLLRMVNASPYVQSSGGNTKIRELIDGLPNPLTGQINASISGSLKLSRRNPDPNISAKASVTGLAIGKSDLKSVNVQASLQHGILHIQKLEAQDKEMSISADGSFGPSGSMAWELDAHGVPIEAARQWMKLPDNFSGRADVTLVASGRIDSPNSEMSFEVADPVIEGVKFDALRGRLSTIGHSVSSDTKDAKGEVQVDDLLLALGNHSFQASGHIPVDWQAYKISQDRPMFFESHLDRSSIDLLSAFTGMKLETSPNGEFGGNITLSGSIKSPSLDGELIWKGGKISIPRVDYPLQSVDAKVVLKGDQLSIDHVSGVSAGGGAFKADGKISLKGMKPTVDLALTTDNLAVSSHNISNSYGEDIKARFNSNLKVTGDWRSPTISGNVGVPSASISIAGKPAKSEYVHAIPVNVMFDVRASLSKDVQVRSGRLRTPLYGDVLVRGSLAKPIVEANLDIGGGTISFPMRQLRIEPGSTLYMHAAPPFPATVLVDMRADGRLPSTSLLGKTKNYTVAMTAKGPMSNLDSSFTSNPPDLSEQDIISLLSGKQQLQEAFNQNGNTDIAKILHTAVMPTVFETVGDTVQDIFGIGEFGLETGYNEPVRLTLGNQITNGLYLDYTSVLGARPDYSQSLYEVKLSYRFRHGLQIDIGTGDKQGLITSVAGALRF